MVLFSVARWNFRWFFFQLLDDYFVGLIDDKINIFLYSFSVVVLEKSRGGEERRISWDGRSCQSWDEILDLFFGVIEIWWESRFWYWFLVNINSVRSWLI